MCFIVTFVDVTSGQLWDIKLVYMRALAAIVVFLASLPVALAQTGTVKSEGQSLPGATVRATQGDRILTTLTDANGDFQFPSIPVGGPYVFEVLSDGTWTTLNLSRCPFTAMPC